MPRPSADRPPDRAAASAESALAETARSRPRVFRLNGRALRAHNYRLFFAGQLTSMIGTQMQSVAQTLVLVSLTKDPFVLGLAATMQYAPAVLFGLLSGVLIDHLPLRRTLVIDRTIAMLLAGVLFWLVSSGTVQVWQILLIALLSGTVNVFDVAARQAFYVEMVAPEDLPSLVGFNWALANIALVAGPVAAGILIERVSIAIPFLLNAVSFLALIGAYVAMRPGELRGRARLRFESGTQVRARLLEGIRFVHATPIVLTATVLVAIAQALGMSYGVVLPSIAGQVVGPNAGAYGLLVAAAGAGSIVASVSIAMTSTFRRDIMGLGAIVVGLATLSLALAPSFAVLFGAMVLVGLGGTTTLASTNSIVQIEARDAIRGRVMSVYTTTMSTSALVGGLVVGAAASSFGAPVAATFAGIICACAGLAAIVRVRRLMKRRASDKSRA